MLPELLIMLGMSGAKWGARALTQKTTPDEYGVFLDGNGNHRLYPSLKQVYYGYTPQGEFVLWYSNGGMAINIDLERSKQYEKESIKNGRHFYLRTPKGRLGNYNINGARYCRVNQPETYYAKKRLAYDNEITHEYYYGDFYMDMDYRLICASDETNAKDIKRYGEIKTDMQNKIIDMFNERTSDKENVFINLMSHQNSYTFKIKMYEKYKKQDVVKKEKTDSMPF